MRHLLAAAAVALTLTGCATNPVTGKNELHMVSEARRSRSANSSTARVVSRRAATT